VRAALRSQTQASSSPFAGGTAMAGRAAKGGSPEKPGAPPAGGRRGQVELLAHAYATCDVMSGLDRDRTSILTIMFVRDSCSKQLDSDRLAAESQIYVWPSVCRVWFSLFFFTIKSSGISQGCEHRRASS
jgi:hypothetical protein